MCIMATVFGAEKEINFKKEVLLMKSKLIFASAFLCVFAMFWTVPAANAQCTSGSNCQIVLSGTGLPTDCAKSGVSGFWLWAQPSSANNAYGEDGQGNMYFYGLAQAPVEISNVVLSGSTVSETASGTTHSGVSMSCNLTAHETSAGHGILDSANCTVNGNSCSITTPAAITVEITNVK
jgi:hypothetical protein